ncbi:uncharacterized protein LOC111260228 isoform X2 [Varroa jacobsoni]|uniref:uncharacterized protein LOC111260228 isoform X2 n=1 Tax=Varroa jacobsoni TaxID=62625 RepID=UPI000BF53BA7|nr:uncharacterized protein LOC111260228 isoform X2 [Varroa jacobsoni]
MTCNARIRVQSLNVSSIQTEVSRTQRFVPRVIPLGIRGKPIVAESSAASHDRGGPSLNIARRSHQPRVSIIRRVSPITAPGVYARSGRPRCIVRPYVPPPNLVPPVAPSPFVAMRRPLAPFDNNARPTRPTPTRRHVSAEIPSPSMAVDQAVCKPRQLLPGQIPVCYPLDRLHNALVKFLGERYLNLLDEFHRDHPHLLDIDDETMRRYLYLDFPGI